MDKITAEELKKTVREVKKYESTGFSVTMLEDRGKYWIVENNSRATYPSKNFHSVSRMYDIMFEKLKGKQNV